MINLKGLVMKKLCLFLILSSIFIVSCSNDDTLGQNNGNNDNLSGDSDNFGDYDSSMPDYDYSLATDKLVLATGNSDLFLEDYSLMKK